MMRIDTARFAKIVPRHMRVECVKLQIVFAPDNFEIFTLDRNHDSAFAAANGTGAASRLLKPVGHKKFKLDGTAVAGGTLFQNFHLARMGNSLHIVNMA